MKITVLINGYEESITTRHVKLMSLSYFEREMISKNGIT